MTEFQKFALAIEHQFNKMVSESGLYKVNCDKKILWQTYLSSFPEGTNPIYLTRTEHDCVCCRNFIRDIGSVVIIKDNKLVSVWDVKIDNFYQVIADNLANYVKKHFIENCYSTHSSKAGSFETLQKIKDNEIIKWNHFYCTVPNKYVGVDSEKLNTLKTTKKVFKRGLDEITFESLNIVLELINQNSLYRGQEFKESVISFQSLKNEYHKISDLNEKDNFCWKNVITHGARIRNTAIGTLLQDLSENIELDIAVASFESKVAPINYKRPTALITKGMLDKAMTTINQLGIESSLYRRFAVAQDLSVNNVLFVDKSVSTLLKDTLYENLKKEITVDSKKLSKIEEIPIADFVKKILPNTKHMEILFENKHTNHLMSLIAPKNEAPNILKWDNNFSWSYNGNFTDSIKEKVKKAGGNVSGVLRFSLSWFNFDDLDLHVEEPGGHLIYFGAKKNYDTSGALDVDMNAGAGTSREAVENITWTQKDKMKKGIYKVKVHNFSLRERVDFGFVVEMEFNGEIKQFSYKKSVPNRKIVDVLTLNFDGETITNLTLGKDVDSSSISKNVWNINTECFQKVSMLTLSPNHWDNNNIGNKHYFFILDKCLNPEQPRGFYNEFLKSELDSSRKVFEILGEKTKCEKSSEQLSGLGFSSTDKNSVICKVEGSFNRVLKLIF